MSNASNIPDLADLSRSILQRLDNLEQQVGDLLDWKELVTTDAVIPSVPAEAEAPAVSGEGVAEGVPDGAGTEVQPGGTGTLPPDPQGESDPPAQ